MPEGFYARLVALWVGYSTLGSIQRCVVQVLCPPIPLVVSAAVTILCYKMYMHYLAYFRVSTSFCTTPCWCRCMHRTTGALRWCASPTIAGGIATWRIQRSCTWIRCAIVRPGCGISSLFGGNVGNKVFLHNAQASARKLAQPVNRHVQVCWSTSPSFKTASFGAVSKGVRHVTSGRQAEVAFMCHRSGRREQRWQVYITRSRVLADWARRLTEGASASSPVLVAYGSANTGYQSPISRPIMGSQKGLKEALRRRPQVVLQEVDEYNTSKYCSTCVRAGIRNQQPLEDVRGTNRFRVRQCPHCDTVRINVQLCKSTHRPTDQQVWHRNVNAARNMQYLEEYCVCNLEEYCVCNGVGRPGPLQRPPRRPAAAPPPPPPAPPCDLLIGEQAAS